MSHQGHQGSSSFPIISRRLFLAGGSASLAMWQTAVNAASPSVVFLFVADVHACRMGPGLSPNCQQEGKTDDNLLRHIRVLNDLEYKHWPEAIDGKPTGLANAGKRIGEARGVVIGGDMTDDGGGQTAERSEGTQILQFSHRYRQGIGPDMLHMPVYAGLGNHDLDQDGRPPDLDWYRQELRDYVRFNHEPSVFFKPPVAAKNFDPLSDCYSWDWGPLHLVQLHRFGGDTRKGAVSALPWLKQDLATNASDDKPVVLFQHYGWDPFSIERWDPEKTTFDDAGHGAPHWWSEVEQQALLDTVAGANVIGIFHGHEHDTPMIYRQGNIDLFKPIASFKGGFALAQLDGQRFSVVLGEASDNHGGVRFTNAFQKNIA